MSLFEPSQPLEEQFRRCALLVALYAIPPLLVVAAINVLDADLWWHVRTGQWIVQHGWVPYTDSFSWTGMGKPWAAYSWLFEVIIYGLFVRFGLLGVLIYTYLLVLAITLALHALIRKFEPRLAYSVGLTAVAIIAMTRICSPRPWLFTILFFCIELNILVTVRRSRNLRRLLWLLPLFALWANLHIQFVYGLFLLSLGAVEEPLVSVLRKSRVIDDQSEVPLPSRILILLFACCILATLLNPYHFHIYSVLYDTIRQAGFYDLIRELQALPFRALPDWLVLFLTIGAAFAFGRANRRTMPLWILLFITGTYVSFRANRDVWFIDVVAATIIARASGADAAKTRDKVSTIQVLLVIICTGALLVSTIRLYGISNAELQKMVEKSYPSAAASYIEEHELPGPLYNHFNWGGYLIWRLPNLPVSIDGRGNLHDAAELKRSGNVWNGQAGWVSDPELSSAGLIVAERNAALTQLLRLDDRFQQVYEDDLAVVFVRR